MCHPEACSAYIRILIVSERDRLGTRVTYVILLARSGVILGASPPGSASSSVLTTISDAGTDISLDWELRLS